MKKSPTLHIVYIITKLELGGAQKVCLSLLKGANQQHSASLISGNEGVLVEAVKDFDNIFLLPSFKREIKAINIFSEVRNFIAVIKILKKLKKQYPSLLVHTHSTKAGLIGRWAAFFAGIKQRIHTIHGYGFHDHQPTVTWGIIYFLELITSFITTNFICVSHKDYTTGVKLFPKFSKKSTLIRAAVDWETFYIPARKVTESPTKKFIIGSIACFKPQKNLLDLLKAFAYARDLTAADSLHLAIIGDGAQRDLITTWVERHNLSNHITLLGWQHDIATFLKTWDLFALSSLWEGLPCAIIEARLQKLPVVAYNVGGIEEVVLHGKNGYLTQAGDWQQLGSYLAKLYSNGALYKKFSHFPDNLDDFKNESMIAKHLSLYQKMVSL